MTSQPDIEQRQQSARERVQVALALINREKPTATLLLVDVANAVNALCQAFVMSADIKELGSELGKATSDALYAIAPSLSEAARDEIPPEDIYFMLGNAAGLLTVGNDGFHRDRLNYASILYARLRLAFHGRDLKARGYPLASALQAKLLMDTPRLPTDPIH